MKTSEVLNRAADLIEERGWATGNCGMAVDGPYCLEGAISAALESGDTFVWSLGQIVGTDPAIGTVCYAMLEPVDCPPLATVKSHLALRGGLAVWGWNDEANRTAAEVIEVLRAAAIIEAAREVDVQVVAPEQVTA